MTHESPHWLSLTRTSPVFENDLGSIQVLDATSFPILSRLSIKRLTLVPGAMREPSTYWAQATSTSYPAPTRTTSRSSTATISTS